MVLAVVLVVMGLILVFLRVGPVAQGMVLVALVVLGMVLLILWVVLVVLAVVSWGCFWHS